jgi:2-oxoglutarate ferredoxin oxidoreductase subunit alpha
VEERRRPTAGELESYVRFRATDSGVSPLSQPGLAGGNYLASGIEHNEDGSPTASGISHQRMNEKRFRKMRPLKRRRDLFEMAGDPSAPLALISWGSSAGVCREAVELAAAEGIRVKLLIPYLLYPVAEDVYREFFASTRGGLVVEQSHQGQLHRILRMHLDLPSGIEPFNRSGANPFLPADVVGRLKDLAQNLHRRLSQTLQPHE